MSGTLQERRTKSMKSRFSTVFARISKRCCGHDREGWHIELVLRHTCLSSSRRPYDPCLGWFINLRELFRYLVALQTYVSRQLWRSQIMEHTSCLQAQCTDVMGSRSRWCRIIMEGSASAKGQECRALQIEWGRRQMQLEGKMRTSHEQQHIYSCKSFQRIPVIVM